MESVGAYEAKTHLPRLLEQVAAGASVTITKHGHAVARLVPAGDARPVGDVIDEMAAARRGVTLGRISLKKLIEEGRR